MKKMPLFLIGLACGLLLGFGGGFFLFRSPAPAAEPLPADLPRLATSALRRAGLEDQKAAFVTPVKTLPDGSQLIKITLESGKTVDGRFYLDRGRYKISIDRSSLLEHKVIVVKE